MIVYKYPSQHGTWSFGTKLPESEPTVGEMFHRAGYNTALVDKALFQPLEMKKVGELTPNCAAA